MAQTDAFVLGVGVSKFLKPKGEHPYTELGFEAGVKAMLDAQITYDDVDMGVGCFSAGETCSGQRVFYQFGMSTIPIYNTNNACATGSTGLHMARTLVRSGAADCVLVIGFEQMAPGAIKSNAGNKPSAHELMTNMMEETYGKHGSPRNCQWFANAGREYMEKYGAEPRDFAEIARISHKHSQKNPYAQFQKEYTLKEIEDAPMIHFPVTKLQCSPTSDGAAAAVIVSKRFLEGKSHLRQQAVLIAGQSLLTDSPQTYSRSAIDLVGYDMTKRAVKAAMKEANVTPKDIKLVELHDCFSANELILLESLGFCEVGKAHEMVRRGDITYGGNGPVINPSGGLISKGHPLGATGVAQCAELVWHLRGWANNRLVEKADVGLQHNLGMGGAVVVSIYKRADGQKNRQLTDEEIVKQSAFDYNPATEARTVSQADFEKVRSKQNKSEYAVGDSLKRVTARL